MAANGAGAGEQERKIAGQRHLAWEIRKTQTQWKQQKSTDSYKKPSDDVTRTSRRGKREEGCGEGEGDQLPAEELPIDGPLKFKRSA